MVSELDLEKSGLFKGGLLHVDILNAHGGLKPTAERMVGDLQTVSDIEATRSTRIYEGWFQQSILDGKLSVKLGIIDLNSEFLVSDSGNLYINSSFNLIPSMFINNSSDAVYPEPAPAVRLKYSPNESLDFLAGFFQGKTLNSDVNAHSTHFGNGEGLLSIEEGQYHYKVLLQGGLAGTIKTGFWYNSNDAGGYENNYGGYALIDQRVFQANDAQGLSVFFLEGLAPDDRNIVQDSIGAGLNYAGLIPYRPSDVMGVALTHVAISSKLRSTTGQGSGETTYEWTYQIQINPSIHLQPDIQYVQKPGGYPNIKNATVFMLRTDVHF
ncbi:MAG: carbohydrate porin [Candidatus Omnitrophica bacterium]|nr:carbohydrate porin [Candidatus Omnitrophota bacterium]